MRVLGVLKAGCLAALVSTALTPEANAHSFGTVLTPPAAKSQVQPVWYDYYGGGYYRNYYYDYPRYYGGYRHYDYGRCWDCYRPYYHGGYYRNYYRPRYYDYGYYRPRHYYWGY